MMNLLNRPVKKTTLVDLVLWLVVAVCVAGMGYGVYAKVQYLNQRDLPATNAAIAEAANASPCIAARIKDKIDQGQPVKNDDLMEHHRDCDALASAQLEKARRTEAAQRQAKALQRS